ncbi:MAG: invasin domain 3-containing protein [Actinomycetota bacterium]
MSLTLAPSTITADEASHSVATASVTDAYGNPVPAQQVSLSTNGDATVPASMTEGPTGYTATITASTTADDETLTAVDGSFKATATLHEVAGAPATLALVASPSTVQPQISIVEPGTSTLKATVLDQYNNLVQGATVSFAITHSESGGVLRVTLLSPTLTAPSATTDSNGVASVTYKAGPFFGNDQVTASVSNLKATASLTVVMCNSPCPTPLGP